MNTTHTLQSTWTEDSRQISFSAIPRVLQILAGEVLPLSRVCCQRILSSPNKVKHFIFSGSHINFTFLALNAVWILKVTYLT